jgi:Fe2+ or Zn2+ uptake regulation protein
MIKEMIAPARRQTKQRQIILDYLRSVCCHPTAEIIYKNVRKRLSSISLATVYRNLNLLVKEGEVLEIVDRDGQRHFDGDNQDHLHYLCEKCGAIFDSFQRTIFNKSLIKTIGTIRKINCLIIGDCLACQKKYGKR